MNADGSDKARIDEIIKKYEGKDGILIQLLLDLQEEFSWLSKDSLQEVSFRLKIPMSRIFRAASFYKAMSLSPVGRHKVSICMGTACQVRGAQRLLDKTESMLGIKAGQTTPDGNFTLYRVNCLGCCAIGPVMVVDDVYHGRAVGKRVDGILKQALQEKDYAEPDAAIH
ncbi:MAG TPA: NAD(P)H-dependent oxidoreductase subunit E [Methanothrix sp.]|jgi:NADH-quinone oxidoreductase subunit E|nr:NAD(P)H-dependent oxidoreductase subunit E [Methanothrix sp.]HOV83000.1 NAD(P)H-dependent oxidoreductase subunit E [Methanothrix sp.]HPC89581.1 NAD(P)H-dependent oxidoreductase subunit E [Methanothrix sp.]HQE87615.1 NAD(P)H-dependent oxidoreductase subunit E [Methanothrix sp.]HQI68849.1 NAD(P)H-dependent oxidoreductase subunit E [Methanothrix sp.]